ncbi:MAG: 2-oxoglutarate dehydrogenase E1 component [Bacteroidales bacterium]|nr:2-oxoglutarate dehydrogenase E1 component [Bacteroidales bacterium]
MDNHSYINNADPAWIEQQYQRYLQDPESVEKSWQHFFRGFEFAQKEYPVSQGELEIPSEFKVMNLISDYRSRGHLFTKTNPVRSRRQYSPDLDFHNFDLNDEDLEKQFQAGAELGIGKARLKDIIQYLEDTYCQSIGSEYMFIRKNEITQWLRQKIESNRNQPDFSTEEKKRILDKLSKAVFFEKFIHKKFPGQKRFSLEGAESLIPALDAVIEHGAELGNREYVIGMAHRGRLNVLTNILKKSYQEVFTEFEGKEYDEAALLGDVKYHLGYTSERNTEKGQSVKLTLAPNPSHLESVDPVVQGIVRARIDHLYQGDSSKITPILIHGDASISGQGIIYEIAQMSELQGYSTGGTIHLVINNQLGFTTNYLDGRSSTYSTDVAKITQSPVFHVNGDDVEAVTHTIKLAMEFREKFGKDVFVDLLCYRKYGHNESDEPRFTQPILYKTIAKHPDPYQIYKEHLSGQNLINESDVKSLEDSFKDKLEENLEKSKEIEKAHISSFLEKTWSDIRRAEPKDFQQSPDTGVKQEVLKDIATKISDVPEDKKLFRKIVKLQEERRKMVEEKDAIDWGMAELLAYGSLLRENIPIRLSGQDTERGTFSHRHAVMKVENSEEKHIPLNHLDSGQAPFEIYNSPLSEYGVLGFEYGYSLTSPHTLTIWEAQFGDFNNGGQVIIDQFITSAEEKWNVMNDLVLLLPHGYEGQGPEHSSARMERFLSMAAENNIQIANITTPANFFHILRRQLKRDFRKPLVIFTPKSLLRHPQVVSPLKDFTSGGFREVIDDPQTEPEKVKKVVLVSGKLYYELMDHKKEKQAEDTAIVRLEQIYPLPYNQLAEIIHKYKNAKDWIWAQEEPGNMGAWQFIRRNFTDVKLRPVTRPDSGSPATGSSKFHKIRQEKIITKVFGECDCDRVNKECRMICAQREELIEMEKRGEI